VLKNFWECLTEMSNKERCMFIRFTCGLSRLPANYKTEKKLKITIESSYTNDALPRSATCFYTFYLPAYTAKKIMKEKILTAVNNCVDIDADFMVEEDE